MSNKRWLILILVLFVGYGLTRHMVKSVTFKPLVPATFEGANLVKLGNRNFYKVNLLLNSSEKKYLLIKEEPYQNSGLSKLRKDEEVLVQLTTVTLNSGREHQCVHSIKSKEVTAEVTPPHRYSSKFKMYVGCTKLK